MMARAKKEAALTPEERLQAALVPDWEWPYKLPENWCWTRLGNISTVVGGGTPSSSVAEYYENGTIPWISPADLSGYNDMYILRGAKNITKLGLEKSSARLMPAGTVCLSSRAPIGYVAIAKNEICTNQGFKSVLPSPCFIPEYLYWYLKGNKELLESYASGTTFLEISGSKVAQVEFPLAPLAEQQRIVDRIESLFAKLDEAKEKAQTVVDNFETRKAAILHKAFTGELTAKWREAHGANISQWKNCTIGDVFAHTTGKALKKSNQNGVLRKYITTSNLYWGTFDFSEVREMYFTEDELGKCTAKKGDLLLCNGGDVGRAAIWDYDYEICLQNHISKLRKKAENVDVPFFYYYFMLSKIDGNIAGRGIGIASLSARDLLSMNVYLPPVAEQQQISRILDAIFAKDQQAKEAAEAVLEKIDLMKKAILARAFRGELDTNDPNDEPAVELLKKML